MYSVEGDTADLRLCLIMTSRWFWTLACVLHGSRSTSPPGIDLHRVECHHDAGLPRSIITAHVYPAIFVAEPGGKCTTRVRADFGARPDFQRAIGVGRVE